MSSANGKIRGYHGETCVEAVRDSLRPGELVLFTELFRRVRSKGSWKDETIWQNLMSCVVNLPPARKHWKTAEPFLVVHLDGRYELYDTQRHPDVVE